MWNSRAIIIDCNVGVLMPETAELLVGDFDPDRTIWVKDYMRL
tara:strand:+ start:1578 stop:1706 length:129 start_codon:yes stop_codon:yes gene_type:complete